MELTRDEFNDFLDDVLEIMDRSRDKHPSSIDAVTKFCDSHDISDSVRNSLECAAQAEWSDYAMSDAS